MVTKGFSCPSIALVSSAVKTSPNAIDGVGADRLEASRKMLFCITWTFTPEKSSTFWTGLREFVRLRKPFSQ